MRLCKNCGLSMGDAATFCQVCGTLADPDDGARDATQAPDLECAPAASAPAAAPAPPVPVSSRSTVAQA